MQRRGLDALLSSEYINRFISVREFEQAVFAEPVTFIGFPGANGNGSSISADLELAITAKAKNPGGAWEFCKYFLSDEYQDSVEYSFPIKLTALNALKEAAMEKPYYMEGGEKIEYENTYRVDMQTEIEIGENGEADSAKMMELIESVSEPQRYDATLSEIILEEAGAFFAGQKTAEEAAGIIQNRASTYISENR
jgi:ABC-type glycerol-3-phosphate transport system substrate-binding protein